MECNKDEALRAKEISEKKFLSKDIVGAKKFALKAQNLYPDLDGITNMLATLDVYISAENKICGESDWYGILGVDPLADEQIIKKQYRKLALILHPDKNKSIGSDGAFKLISEAWSFLSDKGRRFTYDQKRKARVFQKFQPPQPPSGVSVPPQPMPPRTNGVFQKFQPPQPPSGVSVPPQPMPPRTNGVFNSNKSTTSNMKAPKVNNTTKATNVSTAATASSKTKTSSATASSNKGQAGNIPSSSPKMKPASFWTLCHRCMIQHEYLRWYLNHNLLCPNCRQPFVAKETTPPAADASNNCKTYTEWKYTVQEQITNHQKPAKRDNMATPNILPKGCSSGPNSSSNVQWGPFTKPTSAVSAVEAANVVKQTYDKVKREREEAQAAVKREGAKRRKKNHHKTSSPDPKRDDLGEVKDKTNLMGTEAEVVKEASMEQGKGNANKRDRLLNQLKCQDIMMEKARGVIRKKLNEWIENKKDDVVNEKSVPGASSKDSTEPISIDVPDSDFHDFDKARTESCLGENQVWAAYDDDDGMPRYYAMIHSVISLDPFKIRISWLNSKTNNELGPLNWIESGFTKTSGDFRIGKREISKSVNSFSHMVMGTKGNNGAVQIYPKKGDVWALYKNWSPEWNGNTEDEVIHKYEIVEVIEDYDEKVGIAVAPLVKVAGFKTVFRRHLDIRETKKIPREEMFRFSHQIPSYLLTGQEAPNAPKGCQELDPAATPLEFLQVIKEAESSENERNMQETNRVDGDGDVGEVNVSKQGKKNERKDS